MTETAGPMYYVVGRLGVEERHLQVDVRDCALYLAYSKQPGVRILATTFRLAKVRRELFLQQVITFDERSGASGQSALLLAPESKDALEDVEFKLAAESHLRGSMAARNLTFDAALTANIQLSAVHADSVLIHAFNHSRVNIERLVCRQALVIVDDVSRVEITQAAVDLVLVRQHHEGALAIEALSPVGSSCSQSLVAVTGDRGRVAFPSSALRVPPDVVSAFWSSLSGKAT